MAVGDERMSEALWKASEAENDRCGCVAATGGGGLAV